MRGEKKGEVWVQEKTQTSSECKEASKEKSKESRNQGEQEEQAKPKKIFWAIPGSVQEIFWFHLIPLHPQKYGLNLKYFIINKNQLNILLISQILETLKILEILNKTLKNLKYILKKLNNFWKGFKWHSFMYLSHTGQFSGATPCSVLGD